jgi:hypothetical protein
VERRSTRFTDLFMAEKETHTLIPPREALKILTFVTYHSLRHGCRGTNVLTRFDHGLFSKEECEQLRDEIIANGLKKRARKSIGQRMVPAELH